MKKKFLALFLALCLGCALVPTPASAAGIPQKGSKSYEELEDLLTTFCDFYIGRYQGRNTYDSNTPTVKGSTSGINILQAMLKIFPCYNDDAYPGEKTAFQIGPKGFDIKSPDPLHKYDYYSKVNAKKVEWVLKNIFNCSDSAIAAMKEPIANGQDPDRYYYDGYYYYEEGDVGWMRWVESFDIKQKGENYLVRMKILPYEEAPESEASYFYAVVQRKTINEMEYWSLYYCTQIDSWQDPLNTAGFLDVASNAYYRQPVLWAVDEGITSGTGLATFSPDAACTRGQTVMFLWNAAGKPAPSRTSSPFVDVKNSDYYFNAVLWAVEKGIVSGTDATHFNPGKTCTRAEAVTFLWRTYGEGKTSDVRYFNDVSSGSWYKDAVNWSVENGLTTGTGGTSFSPDKSCTRGQIVTFLYRTLEGGLPESQRPEALPEALPISVTQIEAERISRQQIRISWTAPSEGEVETYLVKRRLASEQTGEWTMVAEVSASQVLQVTDQLPDTSIQQYVYTIDILPKDPLRCEAQAGAQVLASNLLICLDPGHYLGVNQIEGDASYGYDEGDAVLRIAWMLGRELKSNYGIEVCMTREGNSITLGGYTDQALDQAHLELRGNYAREKGSDLFLSLHTNANQDNANGYETCLQPISINKPILIANTIAAADPTVIAVANAIGTEIAKESYYSGTATVATFRTVAQGRLSLWSDFHNDSLDIQGSVYYRIKKNGNDYYGVLRGAAEAGIPGLIIEHGMHTVPEVRQAAMEGDLLTRWAYADARGIASGLGFIEKN